MLSPGRPYQRRGRDECAVATAIITARIAGKRGNAGVVPVEEQTDGKWKEDKEVDVGKMNRSKSRCEGGPSMSYTDIRACIS
jgi:hypothetical protein